MFSDTVTALLGELGISIERLLERFDFNYGSDGKLGPATYFDKETYGRDVLIPGLTLRYVDPSSIIDKLEAIPMTADSRSLTN